MAWEMRVRSAISGSGHSRTCATCKTCGVRNGTFVGWFYHELRAQGIPAICIDARHAKAALDMAANKTDANDADGLAHLAEVGFYKEVRVKEYDSMLTRTLVGARRQLIKIATELSNHIRGLMKTFGYIVPKGAGRIFEGNVRSLLADNPKRGQIILPLLEAWHSIRTRSGR